MRTKSEQIVQKLGEMTIVQIQGSAAEILASPGGEFLFKAMCMEDEANHRDPVMPESFDEE